MSYRIVKSSVGRAVVACLHCDIDVMVDLDEDGVPCLEATACHVEGCENRMCPECVAVCFSCDSPTCSEHLTDFEGDKYCPCCLSAMADEGEALLVEGACIAS